MENTEPTNSEVFTQTNGEKIRVDYDRVFIYSSKEKSKVTAVEIGWSPDTEIFLLDIDFEDFDAKYQSNRAAWKAYWKNLDGNRNLY
jgi:hypothetical protein